MISPSCHISLSDLNIIVATTVHSTRSSLERLYRQASTTMEALGAIEVGTGAFIDVSTIFDELV